MWARGGALWPAEGLRIDKTWGCFLNLSLSPWCVQGERECENLNFNP